MNGKFPVFSMAVVLSVYFWVRDPGTSTEAIRESPVKDSAMEVRKEKIPVVLQQVAAGNDVQSEKPPLNLNDASKKWETVSRLLRCAEEESCSPSEKESREKHFFLKEKILAEIGWFRQFHADTDEARSRSYEAAVQILKYPEEEVQSAALGWVLELPVSPNTIKVVEAELKDVVDPNLVILLLLEFKRYQGTPLERRSLKFLKSIFTDGSVFASRELARSIGIVLTHENQSEVSQWLQGVSQESAKYRLLSESLFRFRRSVSM